MRAPPPDDPYRPLTVAVVGGGLSGTLAAAQLLRQANAPLRVVLVERRADVGRGVAYSTRHPRHLLNVPAGRMSARPDRPDSLLDWLRAGPMPDVQAGTFIPRHLYGDYLAHVLAEAARTAGPGVVLERRRDDVVRLTADAHGAMLELGSGEGLAADRVVLAVGHGAPQRAVPTPVASSERYAADPWAPGALDVGPESSVVLVGTGLTMVDCVLTLAERGHTGPILALSRRGLAPHAHRAGPAVAPDADVPDAATLVRRLRASGDEWRGALDALRPHSAAVWQSLAPAEQRRFLRHLRPYWDVHRHRIAPESAATLAAMQASGQLSVRAGRLVGGVETAGALALDVRFRGESASSRVVAQRVVNCTGTSLACSDADNPVLAGLLASGAAVRHPLGLGLSVDDAGALVGADGHASDVLFTLGPLLAGHLWETVAVPEIRAQAAALPARLFASVLSTQPAP